MAVVHVVGAGLAGLAAAVRLTQAGREVRLYEAANRAGGRCRSQFDRQIGRVIDNGNHLLLSGNRDALAYLATIDALDQLTGPAEARFPFVDLRTGARWVVRPNRGRLPWWILCADRRVPGTSPRDYLAAWRLARAAPEATVADCLDRDGPLWRPFWDPLARAVLNTPPTEGSARSFGHALVESFALGGAGCRPLIARESLAASLIDPALAWLGERGVRVAFGRRLQALQEGGAGVRGLVFRHATQPVATDDRLILAVPPAQVAALLPGTTVPERHHAIVNGHFRLPEPARLPEGGPLLGLIGGTAEWLFVRGDLVSLTVSAADALAEAPADRLLADLWRDTARALGLPPGPPPPGRIVKERRATFAQTPAAEGRRPSPRTRLPQLFLAGDWTATGLPATIEGAIRSGHRAAALVINQN